MAKTTGKSKSNPELVYVIAGEPTLANAQCTELIDRLITPQEKATGLLVADADKITITELLDKCAHCPS